MIKRYLIITLFAFLTSSTVFGQFLFQAHSTYSTGNYISPNATGGNYVVGNYICNVTVDTFSVGRDSCPAGIPTPLNFYVLKLNTLGEAVWLKSSNLNSTDSKYTLYGAFADASDRLWLAGNFTDSMIIENQGIKSTGPNDVFVARFNADGSLDTLLGNFAYDVSSAVYLTGFKPDLMGNGLLFGAFKGSMKSSLDTIAHTNSQLFLTKLDAAMQSEFLITKLDTPIVSCDSSAIVLLTCNGTQSKMAISVVNATEYQIDTTYIPDFPNPDIMIIDTNLVSISENTFIAEWLTPGTFQYNQRANYLKLASISYDAGNNYYLLDNMEIAGDKNIQIEKYNAADMLQWSHQTLNTQSSITLKGKTLSADASGNVYYGGYYQSTATNRTFTIGGIPLTANKDKNALVVKLASDGSTVWAQSLGSTTTVDGEVGQNHDAINQLLAFSETNILTTGFFGNELTIAGLNIQNPNGINNLFVGTLDPYPSFTATLTASGSTDICIGDSLLLTATQNATYSYVWKKDGIIIPGATSNSYYAKDSSVFYVEITNPFLPYTKKTKTIAVSVNPIPPALLETADDTIFCEGEKANLSTVNNSSLTYRWYKDNIAIAGAIGNSYNAIVSGIFQVQVETEIGCFNRSNAIEISALKPIATISLVGSSTFCDGDSVLLNAAKGIDYKYQWFFDGDSMLVETTDYIFAKKSGGYQVETTVLGNCQTLSENTFVSVIPSPPAVITFSGDSVLCEGEQTAITANSGFNLSYIWMLNNDTLPGETLGWLNTNKAGIYRAIVGFEGSCSRWSEPKTVVVNPLPVVSLQVNGDTVFCQGQQTLLSTPDAPGYAFQWLRNNNEITGALSHEYAATQTGAFSARITNSFGCQKDSPYQSILVKYSPDATLFIDGDTTFCELTSVDLFTYNQTNQTYQWYKNGKLLTNQTAFNLNVAESGNYSVWVTSIENLCTTKSRTIETQLVPAPQEVILASKELPICDGDSLLLSVSTNPGWHYQWLFNGYDLFQDTLPQLMAREAGNYSVVVRNPNNCSSTAEAIPVTLLSNPVPSITVNGLFLSTNETGSLIWDYNNEPIDGATNHLFLAEKSGIYSVTAFYTNGCFASSVQVSVCNPVPEIKVDESFLTANEGFAYQWYFEDEKIAGANQQGHRAQVSGTYSVEVTCDGNYTSFSEPVLVCIPVPKITQTAINVLEASAGNSYQWYKDNILLEGEDARVLAIKNSGEYTVWVKDLEGCTSFAKPLDVNYSGFTQNSSKDIILIYPNPAHDEVSIELAHYPVAFPTLLKIYDLRGQLLFTEAIDAQTKIIKLSIRDYPNGVYSVLVQTPEKLAYKKLVIY